MFLNGIFFEPNDGTGPGGGAPTGDTNNPLFGAQPATGTPPAEGQPPAQELGLDGLQGLDADVVKVTLPDGTTQNLNLRDVQQGIGTLQQQNTGLQEKVTSFESREGRYLDLLANPQQNPLAHQQPAQQPAQPAYPGQPQVPGVDPQQPPTLNPFDEFDTQLGTQGQQIQQINQRLDADELSREREMIQGMVNEARVEFGRASSHEIVERLFQMDQQGQFDNAPITPQVTKAIAKEIHEANMTTLNDQVMNAPEFANLRQEIQTAGIKDYIDGKRGAAPVVPPSAPGQAPVLTTATEKFTGDSGKDARMLAEEFENQYGAFTPPTG